MRSIVENDDLISKASAFVIARWFEEIGSQGNLDLKLIYNEDGASIVGDGEIITAMNDWSVKLEAESTEELAELLVNDLMWVKRQ